MESPILAAAAGAAAMLLLVAVVLTVTRGRRSRHDLEARLGAARAECDALRQRLAEVTGRPVPPVTRDEVGRVHLETPLAEPSIPAGLVPEQADFVITHVGEAGAEAEPVDAVPVPDRLVLSATLGEPLVKVAAFSYGVRRALSARSRNRIWFEMRSEVRASRRRRRQLRKRLEREYRAGLRTMEDTVVDGGFVEGRT